MQALQLLAAPLASAAAAAAATQSSQQQQQQQSSQPQGLPPVGSQSRTGKVGLPSGSKQQQLRGKGGKGKGSSSNSSKASQQKSKTGGQAATQDRLFTRRTQQQQQQQQGSQGVGGADADKQHGLVDDLLCLFEGVLLHLMPAAVRGWEALGLSDPSVTPAAAAAAGGVGGAGMWPAAAAAAGVSEEQQVAVAMFQAVVGVLQTVMDAGEHT